MIDFITLTNLQNYSLNPYSIPPFIVATLVLALGLLIFALERKSKFNRSLLYLCLSSCIWLLGYSLVFNAKSADIALFWTRILYIGLIVCPVNILYISLTYTNRVNQEKYFLTASFALALLGIALIFGEHIVSGVRRYFWGFYPEAGSFHPAFLIFLSFCPVLGFLNLITYYRGLTKDSEKKRIKFLLFAFVFTSLSNVDILPSYGIAVYPFGYISILCFVTSTTYSIIKYRSLMVERHAKELEEEVEKKTNEISQIVAELRATQLKLLETGKISALASLSAGILHQISQPITAIHGFVKFMKKEMKETDPFYKPVALMEEQSVYLKDMLEDLMELIRHREIRKERVDVNVCLKRAANLLTDELRIRRVDWDMNLGEHLPLVFADAVHLQQIFMNIIVNALQALGTLPKGAKRYLKITTSFDEALNKIMISFQDTGPGLSDENKSQIFEPFFSTKTKGSGLGLALCKDLIAEHGGEIGVESEPGEGANFSVRLPCLSFKAP